MARPALAVQEELGFRPLFVVGASRSGTTMLNRILDQHEQILAMNELHYFGTCWDPDRTHVRWDTPRARRAAAELLARIHRGIWGGGPNAQELEEAGRLVHSRHDGGWSPAEVFETVLFEQAAQAGTRYVTEQTPRNVFYASELLDLFPEAKVIQIVRDPRAVLYSQKRRWRKHTLGARWVGFGNMFRLMANYHPLSMGHLWRKSADQAWALQNHPRYKMIRFEDLVRNPAEQVKEICAFLELSYRPEMLQVPQIGSSHQVHRPGHLGISAEVADVWRRKLGRGDQVLCEWLLADQMLRFGYVPCTRRWWYPALLIPVLRLPFHLLGVLLGNPRRAWIQLKALRRRQDPK